MRNYYIIFLFLFGCSTTKQSTNSKFVKQTISSVFPIQYSDSVVKLQQSTVNIYINDSLEIYELPIVKQEGVNGQLISETIDYKYVIRKQGKKTGFYLNNVEDTSATLQEVADILYKQAYGTLENVDSMLPYLVNPTIKELGNGKAEAAFKYNVDNFDSVKVSYTTNHSSLKKPLSSKLDNTLKASVYNLVFTLPNTGGARVYYPNEKWEIIFETKISSDAIPAYIPRLEGMYGKRL